jgi:hypothetical protein
MADPANRDPAEGSRQAVDRALDNAVKNPEHEAENPGGRPTGTVVGSASPNPREPQGQQGSTAQKDR